MKKLIAMLLALVMVLALCACSVSEAPDATEAPTDGAQTATTEISLWTYPIGGWGNQEIVNTCWPLPLPFPSFGRKKTSG